MFPQPHCSSSRRRSLYSTEWRDKREDLPVPIAVRRSVSSFTISYHIPACFFFQSCSPLCNGREVDEKRMELISKSDKNQNT